MDYATATASLPHLMLVSLTTVIAKRAADLAVTHRVRAANAIYLEVARRYATTFVSRDDGQLRRGPVVALCQAPQVALGNR